MISVNDACITAQIDQQTTQILAEMEADGANVLALADHESKKVGICCWFMRYGKCEPPRPPCRFHHLPDDGQTPCCFGPTCRLGHRQRKKVDDNYWCSYTQHGVGRSPAVRDASLLQAQLEPWSTAKLRERLAHVFGEDYRSLDPMGRDEIMKRLLNKYDENLGGKDRTVIQVESSARPVRPDLLVQLRKELETWSTYHTTNTRPSIRAQSYMILRNPDDIDDVDDSRQSQLARKKLEQHNKLYQLALDALREAEPDFKLSALAVTYMFEGSPHIDKQNTGPFCGLSLGDFESGSGGVMVEASPLVVAHVHTKDRVAKIDGRYPHWVAPYNGRRFSLIYYATNTQYQVPGPAYFGTVVMETKSQ